MFRLGGGKKGDKKKIKILIPNSGNSVHDNCKRGNITARKVQLEKKQGKKEITMKMQT